MSYVLLAFIAVILIVLARAVKVVPQKQVKIIERLGKFHNQAEPGLNLILPFVDSVRASHDLRERITRIEPQPVITRDNVTMEVDAVIYYLLVDPVRATYEVQNLEMGIEQLTLSALRNAIGSLDLDHTLTSRDEINSQLRAALDAATQQWGVKVVRVELKNIDPPEEIKLILRAEGLKQSAIVSAEGQKQSAILQAEGQAQARLAVAEAEAQALQAIAKGLGEEGNPARYLIARGYLESLTAIAGNAQKTVFLPYEASAAMSAMGAIKELWSGASTEGKGKAG
jgi:regulator of protease activity HflC (stomatin/prohibitin superfamily)